MLNKELLLAAGASTVKGHIKLTVGSYSLETRIWYGYAAGPLSGSLSKVPMWYDKQKTLLQPLNEISSEEPSGVVSLFLSPPGKAPITTLKVTVVEKDTTVIFTRAKEFDIYKFNSNTKNLFKASDVGKTFNIIFDPPPDSYA